MKVSVLRGGGVGGMVTRTELGSEALSPADAEALERRVREAGVLEPPDPSPRGSSSHPDELAYELTVDDGERSRTVRVTEESMPEPVRSLIDWTDSRPERDVKVEPPGGGSGRQ
jgi:hypothetical protein